MFAFGMTGMDAKTSETPSPLPIRGFMPKTNVINHMYLDWDLREILKHMLSFSDDGNDDGHDGGNVLRLDLAQAMYEQGGHAVRQAVLTVPPLTKDMKVGDYVFQPRPDDWTRSARLRASAPAGSTQLILEYTSYQRPCFSGATKKSTIKAQYGVEVDVSHHCLDTASALYDKDQGFANQFTDEHKIGLPITVDHQFVTVAELSSTAAHRMNGEAGFELARAFYGSGDFAHLAILNAFDRDVGRPLSPLIAYQTLGHSVGSDIVRKIIVFMSIQNEVVHQMSRAIQICDDTNEGDCIGEQCENSAMHGWDKAAAYYAGASWGDTTKSVFLDGNAQDMCRIFGTCDNKGDALSNKLIYKYFEQGQDNLVQGDCEGLLHTKARITKQMYVPVFQNILRIAYALTTEDWVLRDRAQGVFFVKLIQPKVETCDAKIATLITENLVPDEHAKPMASGFDVFKRAIESLYPCFEIRCIDIGGILAEEIMTTPPKGAKYVKAGEPCGLDASSDMKADSLVEPATDCAEQVCILMPFMAIVAAAVSLP